MDVRTVFFAALGVVVLGACGDSSEFPADISGDTGALRDLQVCNVMPDEHRAEMLLGDLYKVDITLPPFEDWWGQGRAGIFFYDDNAEAYDAGAAYARVQYGHPLDEDPSCDGCGRVIRPVFIEGLRFSSGQMCQVGNTDVCLPFGGGSVDRMYMFCDSQFEGLN